MPGRCETGQSLLGGPRCSCRRSPGPVLSWRGGGGGCGRDALSWLGFVMVPETPRPPQLALQDYHMTEAEGLRAAAATLDEEGIESAVPRPRPLLRWVRVPPTPSFHHPLAAPRPRHVGRGSQDIRREGCRSGCGPRCCTPPGSRRTGLSSLASPTYSRPFHLPALIFSFLPLFFSWTSHSGPSSEHRGLKASLWQEIPMPVGFRGKLMGRRARGIFVKRQLHNFIVSQLYFRLYDRRRVHSSLSYRTAI